MPSVLFRTYAIVIMPVALMAMLSPAAATPVYKCATNGSVTYQSDPCPSGQARKSPSVEQLNAERHKKLRQSAIDAAAVPAVAPAGPVNSIPGTASESRATSERERPIAATAPRRPSAESFKCDGRIHCSQMTSCSEAQYFLGHCPGVKMDGDRNGIPCEKQWCNR
jgi:hypothetical protein